MALSPAQGWMPLVCLILTVIDELEVKKANYT
jgi:hypothetical protein